MADGPTAHPWRHRGHAAASGSMPRRSLTAYLRFCSHPRYRSVVWTETWPRRNWILFELAASQVTEPGARATKIVRGQFLDVCVRRRHPADVPQPVRARVSASSSASEIWGVAWGDASLGSSPDQLKTIRRVGRPPLGNEPRRLIAIRVDPSVLESFRKEARRRRVGYQTLINEVLAEHIRKDVA